MTDSNSQQELKFGACTIVSPNYLPFAKTLSTSYLKQHPTHRFFVLVVANLSYDVIEPLRQEDFTAILLTEIGLEDLSGNAMKYDILELNTNVKPTFLKYLIKTYDLEYLLYLDPDIFVYQPLTPVFSALVNSAAVLTPHITSPVSDGKRPNEQDFLSGGTYNLGFIGVKRCTETSRLLDWWESRCLECGFSEPRTGLFVDQKWINLVPGLFQDIAILRHPGCNMAYWNLHDRTLSKVNNQYFVNGQDKLCFYHFSGVLLNDPQTISKYTDRFTLLDRLDLAELFQEYRTTVVSNKSKRTDEIPYGFDRLTDGTLITSLARRIYAERQDKFSGQNPFEAEGEFARFAKRRGLLAGKVSNPSPAPVGINPVDPRVKVIHIILRVCLKILGPNRYELFMRYLAHIATLRKQAVFIDKITVG